MKNQISYSIIALLFIGLLFQNCSTKKEYSIKNLENTNTIFDTILFSKDNNFAKNAITVKDGFLITGQKFTKTDSTELRSATIKTSFNGSVLKKKYSGNDNLNHSRLETIFKINKDRIIQIGEKQRKLWVREIDDDLNVINDLLIPMDINSLNEPKVGIEKNGFIILYNNFQTKSLFNLSYFNNDLINTKNIKVISDNTNYFDYKILDAEYDSQNKVFYIIGSGCKKRDSKGLCEIQEKSIIIYDIIDQSIKRIIPIQTIEMGKGNIIHINKMFNTIEIYNNRLYIAGVILDNKERKKIAQTFTEYDNYKGSIPFDLNILSFSKDGDKISEFSHTINENQYKNAKIYDILIKENKIHLVGEISSYKQFLSMYLVLNLNGELEEKRIFVDPKSSENRLIKILETSNNNILLLGKGKGWRIMKI